MSLPMREVGMQEVWTSTNLLHPLNLCVLKGNEHQASRARITRQNNWYMVIRN
jgi:hypothetical protein